MAELILEILAIDHVYPVQPRPCPFSEVGGTIGRDDRNTLVLPDRFQRVSRLHAEITVIRGVPILSNRSKTLVVNVGEQELWPGESAIVQDDDEIEVGPYLLRAHVQEAHRAAPPTIQLTSKPKRPMVVTTERLMSAFTEGARLPSDTFNSHLTIEQAELIGGMLRYAVQGVMDLLTARAITQREIRAHTVLLTDQSNNPLAFLPTAEAALMQLLTGQLPGFMHGTHAMQDAITHLIAHDAGVMAGMRASLSNMLLSLDPRNADTALHTLPDAALHVAVASDKARWWDTQNNRYARVLADAEDNFEDAWGRVFVEAYSGAADRVRSDAARAALTVKPKEIEESCPTS